MHGMNSTALLDKLAVAAAKHDDVERRALWMELAAEADASRLDRPKQDDPVLAALSAAFAELLAEHQGCEPPSWTTSVGAAPSAVFLATRSSKAARDRLRAQSPAPLGRRQLFAPAKYLQLV